MLWFQKGFDAPETFHCITGLRPDGLRREPAEQLDSGARRAHPPRAKSAGSEPSEERGEH